MLRFRKNSLIYAFMFLALYALFFPGCEKVTDPLKKPAMTLESDGVAATEAWIKLSVTNPQNVRMVEVVRDSVVVFRGVPMTSDTVVNDTLLEPAHHYTYRAYSVLDGRHSKPFAELQITTMDTTSHHFQWQQFVIESPYGTGLFYDAAIVNENDIWVVGEVYSDSVKPWLRYNAAHWDGQHWELKRIPWDDNGYPRYNILKTIFYFKEGKIWFAGNGIIEYWNNSFINVEISQNVWGPVLINKIWADAPDNIYIAGGGGYIARYNGSKWKKVYSGTQYSFWDIWGNIIPATERNEIMAVASRLLEPPVGKKVIRIKDYTSKSVPDSGLPFSISSVWFIPGVKYYIAGDGLFSVHKLGDRWKKETGIPQLYKNSIRGNDLNDIFIAGDFGLLSHFNGKKWKHFNDLFSANVLFFNSVTLKENIVVAVGLSVTGEGIIVLGKR